jgi:dynein heavy chain
LVGPTGSGKTTNRKTLAIALEKLKEDGIEHSMYEPVEQYDLNPKSITMDELYGAENKVTGEWKDGLMAITIRHCVAEANPNHKWVMCDGPIDALWIENMNTVLDDNKMLCLANSERIKMDETMHMLFEVQDLCVASPATVSRLGMVYMDSQELGWPATVQTWLDKYEGMQEATKDLLKTFFDTFVAKALYFCRKNLREPVDTVDVQKVCTILNLITRIIESEEQIDLSANAEVLHPLITHILF